MDFASIFRSYWTEAHRLVFDPIADFSLEYWKHGEKTVLLGFIGLVVGFVLGRKRANFTTSFQNGGEGLVAKRLLKAFRPPDYHLMNHITVQVADGTTQIDHILVSRFGVFVIETNDYSGWIFGGPRQARWTQVLFESRYRFQNPIRQNEKHVRAVRNHLEFLPAETIKSVVIFVGSAEFKTNVPEGVFRLQSAIDHIGSHHQELLSVNRMQFCVGRLESIRLAITERTDIEHVEAVRRKLGNVYELD